MIDRDTLARRMYAAERAYVEPKFRAEHPGYVPRSWDDLTEIGRECRRVAADIAIKALTDG